MNYNPSLSKMHFRLKLLLNKNHNLMKQNHKKTCDFCLRICKIFFSIIKQKRKKLVKKNFKTLVIINVIIIIVFTNN